MKKTVLALAIVMLLASVSATSIKSQNVTVDLVDSRIQVDLDVSDLTTEDFTYVSNYPIENLDTSIGGSPANCNVESLKIGSEVRCETEKSENFTVSMRFRTDGLITDLQDVQRFRFSQSIYRSTDDYMLRVILPRGFGVVENGNISQETVKPSTGEIGSTGQRIFVEWNIEPSLGESLDFQLFYERVSDISSLRNIAFWIVAVLAGIAVAYLVIQKLLKVDIEDEYSRLSEDEKQILDLIQENDGSILQKDLVDESGYSKAKISGIVSDLVEKDIIRKEKEGRSNKLHLGRKYTY